MIRSPKFGIFLLLIILVLPFLNLEIVSYFTDTTPAFDKCHILTIQDYDTATKYDWISTASIYASFIIPLLLVLFYLIYINSQPRRKEIKRKVAWWIFNILAILIILFFLSCLFLSFANATKSPDARRVSDIKQTALGLELYHDKIGSYPQVSGDTAYDRWEELSNILEPAGTIAVVPDDYCVTGAYGNDIVHEHQYDYKNTPDEQGYVLRALLFGIDHPILKIDIDGLVLGVECGKDEKEIEFCIGKI